MTIVIPESRGTSPEGHGTPSASDLPPLAVPTVPSVVPSSFENVPDEGMPYGEEPVRGTPPPGRSTPPISLTPLEEMKRRANIQKEKVNKLERNTERSPQLRRANDATQRSSTPITSASTIKGASISPIRVPSSGTSPGSTGSTCRTGLASFYSYNVPSLNLLNMVRSWNYNELFIEEEVGFRLIYDTTLMRNTTHWEKNNPQLWGLNTTLPQHIDIAIPSSMLDQLYLDYEAMLNATVDPEIEMTNFTFEPTRALPLAMTVEYLGAATANLTNEQGQPIPPRNVTKGEGAATVQVLVTLQWQPTASGSFGLTALFGMSSSQFSSPPLLANPPLRTQSRTLAIAVGASVGGVVVAVAAIIIAFKASTAASSSSSSIRLASV